MSRKPTGRPTDAELAILGVLWSRGPSTVREVLEGLGKGAGYTTVLKFLQIMADKGLVLRDESRRAHVYRAARSREETQGNLVEDLIERAFNGSAGRLAMQALSAKETTPEELEAIRRLLDEIEEGKEG